MSDSNSEVIAEVVSEPPNMESVRAFYIAQREDLLARVAEIETFLGFAEMSADLGTRLARLERFVGLSK